MAVGHGMEEAGPAGEGRRGSMPRGAWRRRTIGSGTGDVGGDGDLSAAAGGRFPSLLGATSAVLCAASAVLWATSPPSTIVSPAGGLTGTSSRSTAPVIEFE